MIEVNWEESIEKLEKKVKENGGEIIMWFGGYPIIKWNTIKKMKRGKDK